MKLERGLRYNTRVTQNNYIQLFQQVLSLPLSGELGRRVNRLSIQLRDESALSEASNVQTRENTDLKGMADRYGEALGNTIYFFKVTPHRVAHKVKKQWRNFKDGFKIGNGHY